MLVHYDDLSADLDAEMRRVAERLGIGVPAEVWPDLVEAATFARMRETARTAIPDPRGVLLDHAAFFRRGRSGSGAEVLTEAEQAHYYRRVAQLAPADLLAWLHR